MESTVSIVIPAFNEEHGIGGVLDAIKALGLHGEMIVIDDGSTDKTAEVARAHGAKVLSHPVNAGYGRSVKDGIKAAAHDIVVMTDADGTYPVEAIPALVEMIARGYDMAVGARQGKAYRGSFFKMPARIVFTFLAEFTTGRRIPDINSGLRAMRKETAMRFFPDLCNGFSFTTTITLAYMLTGKSVGYHPVPYHHRIGHSKVRFVRDSLRTLQYMTEAIMHFNPLKLFLLLTCLSVAGSVIAGIVLGGWALFFGLVASVLVFCLGLVAEAARRPRQE